MNWLRFAFALMLAATALGASPDAAARTVCTANMSDLEFGLANTTTAVIDYECVTTDAFLSNQADVAMCLSIGPGSSSGSMVTQRRMNNAYNDTLGFVIHKTAANPADNWGNSAPSYYQLNINYALSPTSFLLYGGSRRGQITVHGRIPSRTGVAAGAYSSTFNSTNLEYRYGDSLFDQTPGNCSGAGKVGTSDSFPFTARATVPGSCAVVTASNMNFSPGGTPLLGNSTGNLSSTSTIGLTCTNRTAWQVGLDSGMNATPGGNRRMCNPGGACIDYQLLQPDGATPWGDDLDVDTVDGVSAGASQTLSVNGRVTDQPLTQAGRYSDTVKVILTY